MPFSAARKRDKGFKVKKAKTLLAGAPVMVYDIWDFGSGWYDRYCLMIKKKTYRVITFSEEGALVADLFLSASELASFRAKHQKHRVNWMELPLEVRSKTCAFALDTGAVKNNKLPYE